MKTIDFKSITIREKITSRGGGIEIGLDTHGHQGEKMTAYQNYLGGGMLGRVVNDCTVKDWRNDSKLVEVAEELKKYFHGLTNPEEGWKSMSYEQNQKQNVSAY